MASAPPATNARWRIIALIFFVYVLMYIDRVNISIAAKYIMPEYGLTEIEFGYIFSAFVLGYALAQIPGGWLGDRYGPRRVMAWAILWWYPRSSAPRSTSCPTRLPQRSEESFLGSPEQS